MTSQSTSGLQQIAQTCQFVVMFGSQFLDNGSSDFKKVYSFVKGYPSTSFWVVWCIIHFCSLVLKMGLKRTNRRLHITQMADLDFLSKTTEASSPQFHRIVIPDGIYITTGNDVITYFRSAPNRVHATGAVTDFDAPKWFLGKISINTKASIFKIYRRIALGSPYTLTWNDITIYFLSAANRTNVPILGHIRVAISR